MNKFNLILSSFLTVSMVTPSMTYGTWDGDDLSNGIHDCTRNHPCYGYYENGHWHALDNHICGDGADDPWTSYEIATLTATLGMTIFMPLVHNAISRFLDYAAYKWHFWRGLKDTGQDLQTAELRDLVDETREAKRHIERLAVATENANGNANSERINVLLERVIETLQNINRNADA